MCGIPKRIRIKEALKKETNDKECKMGEKDAQRKRERVGVGVGGLSISWNIIHYRQHIVIFQLRIRFLFFIHSVPFISAQCLLFMRRCFYAVHSLLPLHDMHVSGHK